MTTEITTIEAFLQFLGNLVEAVMTWLGNLVDFVMDKPLILVPMLIFFIVGGVVGIVHRITRG